MRLPILGLPFVGRDIYEHGHGHMLIRAFDRLVVQHAHGEAFDSGELVTYLNDAVLLAPSMLLSRSVTWTETADEHAFELALSDGGRTVHGQVLVDAQGAPKDFITEDRYMAVAGAAPLRTRWSTPVEGWSLSPDGRRLPTRGRAIWHPKEGSFAYADFSFHPEDIEFNVLPGT